MLTHAYNHAQLLFHLKYKYLAYSKNNKSLNKYRNETEHNITNQSVRYYQICPYGYIFISSHAKDKPGARLVMQSLSLLVMSVVKNSNFQCSLLMGKICIVSTNFKFFFTFGVAFLFFNSFFFIIYRDSLNIEICGYVFYIQLLV